MAESLLKYYSVSILVNALYVPWLWSSDRRELPGWVQPGQEGDHPQGRAGTQRVTSCFPRMTSDFKCKGIKKKHVKCSELGDWLTR